MAEGNVRNLSNVAYDHAHHATFPRTYVLVCGVIMAHFDICSVIFYLIIVNNCLRYSVNPKDQKMSILTETLNGLGIRYKV